VTMLLPCLMLLLPCCYSRQLLFQQLARQSRATHKGARASWATSFW
jgi:hypothetical protein